MSTMAKFLKHTTVKIQNRAVNLKCQCYWKTCNHNNHQSILQLLEYCQFPVKADLGVMMKRTNTVMMVRCTHQLPCHRAKGNRYVHTIHSVRTLHPLLYGDQEESDFT